MEAARLEEHLRKGLSLEEIAVLTGRHASTVGYWVKRHAVHSDRHAAKGGIDPETLSALVAEGLSTREIAERVALSQSTVRHWLRTHGLRTNRARKEAHGVRGVHADRKELECPRHGFTDFWLEARGIYRCLRCRSEAVSRRRRKLKEILVQEAGGRCHLCGYGRWGALQFHHRDGERKEFGLADRGLTRSLEAVRAEASKCVLLCATAIPRWRQVWSKWPDRRYRFRR